LDANFGGGPGFDGLNDDQRIRSSTHCGGGGFDSPWCDTSSCQASQSADSVRLTEDPEELSTTVTGGSYPDFPQRDSFLPCSTVRTLQKRGAFCSDVFRVRSRFGSLLEESIYNMGFVYEEGGVDFRKADAKGRLTNLGN
jgi:hypothetical protein